MDELEQLLRRGLHPQLGALGKPHACVARRRPIARVEHGPGMSRTPCTRVACATGVLHTCYTAHTCCTPGARAHTLHALVTAQACCTAHPCCTHSTGPLHARGTVRACCTHEDTPRTPQPSPAPPPAPATCMSPPAPLAPPPRQQRPLPARGTRRSPPPAGVTSCPVSAARGRGAAAVPGQGWGGRALVHGCTRAPDIPVACVGARACVCVCTHVRASCLLPCSPWLQLLPADPGWGSCPQGPGAQPDTGRLRGPGPGADGGPLPGATGLLPWGCQRGRGAGLGPGALTLCPPPPTQTPGGTRRGPPASCARLCRALNRAGFIPCRDHLLPAPRRSCRGSVNQARKTRARSQDGNRPASPTQHPPAPPTGWGAGPTPAPQTPPGTGTPAPRRLGVSCAPPGARRTTPGPARLCPDPLAPA